MADKRIMEIIRIEADIRTSTDSMEKIRLSKQRKKLINKMIKDKLKKYE